MVLFEICVSRRSFTQGALFCGSPEPSEANKLIPKSYRWRKTALASLLAASCGLSGSSAFALALGRITVQSALGDPLRAEIEILDINAEEASSLKTSLALPEAFKAAGLEYNAALAGAQISLQRRADGRAFIRLTSDKSVSEPFVDLIVEASWASGRIVRDYTLLLDPPSLRATAAVTPAPPPVVPAATISAAPVVGSRPAIAPARAATPARRPPATVAAEPTAAKPRGNGENQVTVRSGDNASKIAALTKPAQVSLDQMLVALLRANQDAFVNSNLNRLKAGAVLTIPTAEQAQALTALEASKTVIAQSRDFNDFRSKLASNAPNLQVAAADRNAGGNIQAQVVDKKPAAATPDKLTLSKGAIQAKAAEEKIAQEKAAMDATQRTAELSKNIKDLSSLGAASGSAPAAPAAAAAPLATPTPAVVPAPTAPVAVASAPAPAAASSAPAVATTPAVPVAVAAPPSPPPRVALPPAEPGLVDKLLENPLILVAVAALIALLTGLGIYKARQRRNVADVDSAFLESRLQPDSFFGASGGQRVDTNDGAATGSSMVYSPSQLDAADDVDPVAEADVYLAYGRDLQAEEILKEALRTHSGRIAVHQKLLDIYAKRRDAKAFEAMANEAFKLTGEQSPEWARICEQGLGIDPTNPLYQPGGQRSPHNQTVALPVNDVQNFAATSAATQKLMVPLVAASAAAAVDLDLDLDFSLDEEPASAIVEAQPSQLERTVAISPTAAAPAPLDMDFGRTTEAMSASADVPKTIPVELNLPDLSMANDTVSINPGDGDDFRQQAEVSFGSTTPIPLQSNHLAQNPFATVDAPLPDVSFGYTAPGELTASRAPLNSPAAADSGMLEFDLGTLSLDLEPVEERAAAEAPAELEDPLATKLALAEEFVSIGDDDGARALIEEVIAEASGDLKIRAQRALSSLG
jgi:pilus assembly protein FimV